MRTSRETGRMTRMAVVGDELVLIHEEDEYMFVPLIGGKEKVIVGNGVVVEFDRLLVKWEKLLGFIPVRRRIRYIDEAVVFYPLPRQDPPTFHFGDKVVPLKKLGVGAKIRVTKVRQAFHNFGSTFTKDAWGVVWDNNGW